MQKSSSINRSIEQSNALSITDFTAQHIATDSLVFTSKNDTIYDITLKKANDLTDSEFTQCFDIIEQTSSEDYKASDTGWDVQAKKIEMKEADMRYLLVRSRIPQSAPTTDSLQAPSQDIAAFASFMLTTEDHQAVIYLYEIHLRAAARNTGLGTHLMALVEHIGTSTGMSKAMLTVFTRNANAERFYRRLGYVEDAFSPRVRKLRGGKVLRPQYFILSKELG